MTDEAADLWARLARLDPDAPRFDPMLIENLRAWVGEAAIGDTRERLLARLAAVSERDAEEARHFEMWRLRLRLVLAEKARDGMKPE